MPNAKPLSWRVQSGHDGGFDELVVRSRSQKGPCLIHAEMMDERSIFVSVGELRIWAHVGRDGRARVTYTEDDRDKPETTVPRAGVEYWPKKKRSTPRHGKAP